MDKLLQEQIEYYRARAAEYDEWFYRKGRYDRGTAGNQQWFDEIEEVQTVLRDISKQEHILELAGGTGIWTQELAKLADKVTVVDASPEMIAINQAKVQADNVTYIQADLFQWQPEQTYDMVFFGFWLSHVPPEKLAPFLEMVASALKPDGIVFMVDSRRNSTGMAKNQPLLADSFRQERLLNDGRQFNIVKIYYEIDPLEAAFQAAGIAATAEYSANFFIYAQGKHKR